MRPATATGPEAHRDKARSIDHAEQVGEHECVVPVQAGRRIREGVDIHDCLFAGAEPGSVAVRDCGARVEVRVGAARVHDAVDHGVVEHRESPVRPDHERDIVGQHKVVHFDVARSGYVDRDRGLPADERDMHVVDRAPAVDRNDGRIPVQWVVVAAIPTGARPCCDGLRRGDSAASQKEPDRRETTLRSRSAHVD